MASSALTETLSESQHSKQEQLLSDLPARHLGALWEVMRALVPKVPNPKASPAVWHYKEVRPSLIEAGKTVSAEQAERRVLMLVNPSMSVLAEAPYTTDTLYSGLQLVNPGETAPAHKHVAFALRYIIEGEGGFTAVDGKKMYMTKGDVILTPSMTWHDHGHEGTGPLIWLDGIDLPLYQSLPTNFAQNYHEPRYPSTVSTDQPDWQFPWAPIKAQLDADPSPHASYEYKKKDGNYISRTLGAQAERIKAGVETLPSRSTCSFIYHCPEGKGVTRVVEPNGNTTSLDWGQDDTFAIPAWSQITHKVGSDADAYLFAITDKPMLEALGMYRLE